MGLAKGTSGGPEGPFRSSPESVRLPAQGSLAQVEAERGRVIRSVGGDRHQTVSLVSLMAWT